MYYIYIYICVCGKSLTLIMASQQRDASNYSGQGRSIWAGKGDIRLLGLCGTRCVLFHPPVLYQPESNLSTRLQRCEVRRSKGTSEVVVWSVLLIHPHEDMKELISNFPLSGRLLVQHRKVSCAPNLSNRACWYAL